MSWTSIHPDEKPTIYRSESVDSPQVAADFKTVVDKMIADKEVDGAAAANELLFVVNATNGFVKIVWWNNGVAAVRGTWIYQLLLRTLWEGEDSFEFDDVCRYALFIFTEANMTTQQGDTVYEIFLETERAGIERIMV